VSTSCSAGRQSQHLGEGSHHQRHLRFDVGKADRCNERGAIGALDLQRSGIDGVEQAEGQVGSNGVGDIVVGREPVIGAQALDGESHHLGEVGDHGRVLGLDLHKVHRRSDDRHASRALDLEQH